MQYPMLFNMHLNYQLEMEMKFGASGQINKFSFSFYSSSLFPLLEPRQPFLNEPIKPLDNSLGQFNLTQISMEQNSGSN